MDTLLMLSGGIDSAYCLWQRVRAGLPTRTHHVTLDDHEGRAAVEDRATAGVLEWMRGQPRGGLIEHSASRMAFGAGAWIPKNYHAWAYWAGTIMASPTGKGITTVILPRHSDAFPSGPDGPGARASDAAYRGHIRLLTGREPVLSMPIVGMTKAEVIADMPPSLLARCWWCRRPQHGRRCGTCPTCRMVDAALVGLPKHRAAIR